MGRDQPVAEPPREAAGQAGGARWGMRVAILEGHDHGDALGWRGLPCKAGQGLAEDLVAFLEGGDDDHVVEPFVARQLTAVGCPVTALGEMQLRQADHQTGGEFARSPQPVGGERDQEVAEQLGRDDCRPPGRGESCPGQRRRQHLQDASRHGMEAIGSPARAIASGDARVSNLCQSHCRASKHLTCRRHKASVSFMLRLGDDMSSWATQPRRIFSATHQMPRTKTAIASHWAKSVGWGSAAARPAAPPRHPARTSTDIADANAARILSKS